MAIDPSIPLRAQGPTMDPIGTLGRIADMQSAQSASEMRKIQLEDLRSQRDTKQQIKDAMAKHVNAEGQPDMEKAMKDLFIEGKIDAAQYLQTTIYKSRQDRAAEYMTEIERNMKILGYTSKLMDDLNLDDDDTPMDEDDFLMTASAVEGILGPEVARGLFPNPDDPTQMPDKAHLRRLRDLGTSETDNLAYQRAALELANSALVNGTKSVEFVDTWKESLATAMLSVTDQAGFEKTMSIYKSMGDQLPNGVLDEYGETWSPEIKTQAEGTLDSMNRMTPKDRAAADATATNAQAALSRARRPATPRGSEAPSSTDIRISATWKSDQMDAFADRLGARVGTGAAMSADEIREELLRIENGHREKLGRAEIEVDDLKIDNRFQRIIDRREAAEAAKGAEGPTDERTYMERSADWLMGRNKPEPAKPLEYDMSVAEDVTLLRELLKLQLTEAGRVTSEANITAALEMAITNSAKSGSGIIIKNAKSKRK